MTTTPRLGLTELAEAMADHETPLNEAMRFLEIYGNSVVIEDRDVSDPSGLTPSEGQTWLVKATGAGAWLGQSGKLAHYINDSWEFRTPLDGLTIEVRDENAGFVLRDGTWTAVGGGTVTIQFPVEDEGVEESATVGRLNFTGAGVSVSVVGDEATINVPGATGVAIDDLADVNAAAPDDGDVLTWDNTAEEWVAAPAPGGGSGGSVPTGGTTGQVLTKASNTDGDVEWTAGSGTAFPGSPATGRKFYRTDRNIEYVYDGTRWLSTQLHTFHLATPTIAGSISDEDIFRAAAPFKGTYGLYLEGASISSFITATANWNVVISWMDAANVKTALATQSTSGLTANQWNRTDFTINAVLNANAMGLVLSVDEVTGTASMFVQAHVHYRLVG